MSRDNTTLYIIPARGGSKGIPHKNIAPLAGKPLIAYSIDVAMRLADTKMICLSTDDDMIRRVAEECGLPVSYRRPPELAIPIKETVYVTRAAPSFSPPIAMDIRVPD